MENNLDHPCKQSCSGWKQGYEKGFKKASEGIDKLSRIPLKKLLLAIDQFTCGGCQAASVCEYAFDPYNTDGDCLAGKQNLVTGGYLVMIFI